MNKTLLFLALIFLSTHNVLGSRIRARAHQQEEVPPNNEEAAPQAEAATPWAELSHQFKGIEEDDRQSNKEIQQLFQIISHLNATVQNLENANPFAKCTSTGCQNENSCTCPSGTTIVSCGYIQNNQKVFTDGAYISGNGCEVLTTAAYTTPPAMIFAYCC